MCGIIGYIGKKEIVPLLITGLKRMEYRGYDSAGLTVLNNDSKVLTRKKKGRVADLEQLINSEKIHSNIGIAHTRWATHGFPNDVNAHPHNDSQEKISIVHNGIIENYAVIKKKLLSEGFEFRSETDTEVLCLLIERFYLKVNDLELAVRLALNEVKGTFGLAIVSTYDPDKIIAARRGSPLILGVGDNEYFVASDASALIEHTKNVVYLDDDEMAILSPDGYITKTISNVQTNNEVKTLEFDLEQIEKGGFEHFMLKEIYEQTQTITDGFRGRLLIDEGNVKLGGLRTVKEDFRNAKRIIISACGTSYNAALVGEYLIEQLAQIPVEVEYASEFRYRSPVLFDDDIVIVISQSGETADTLAAVQEAKQRGIKVIGLVNVVGSSIARQTDAGIYVHAGPEIGVASTKAFTSQLTILTLLALYLGRMRNISSEEGLKIARELSAIPEKIKQILNIAPEIEKIAKTYSYSRNYLYLGRGFNYPVALEGALKLKEISYIHAEGYPAAEMKHGPIALIDENMPVVFIAPKDEIYEKIVSNIEEVKARKGKVIVVTNIGNNELDRLADHIIKIPETLPILTPILSVVPLQLMAYYTAKELNRDIDKPRNLAKSVTVE
ncbi:MAG: glutamine--fructose-6-phosphate aminotransferase [Ignavibacteria bacterium GWF2_33_9]|nr:MAG: glutamine--fructose-6-phosphate aminotransferase [Ignavibacteria bacterium GWF2_33_9]